MRVKMLQTHSFIPPEERRISVKYLKGGEYTVKREWGAAMVKAGHAREIKAPRREQKDEA